MHPRPRPTAPGFRPPPPGALPLALALALAACATGPRPSPGGEAPVEVKLLAINDFHGQLAAGKVVAGRPVGSAPVLAAWLRQAMAGAEARTILVEAGDLVSASPPSSALLQDEPAIAFFNLFADARCGPAPAGARAGGPDLRLDPGCNLVGVVGNHELDEGEGELLRLLGGGDHARGPFLEAPWGGARFPVIAANVRRRARGDLLFPPWVVRERGGARVAFVGAVTHAVPKLVDPAGVAGLRFEDEAEAVNAQVAELRRRGIRAIVVVVHDGAWGQEAYAGPTRPDGRAPAGAFARFVARLDPEVDVVVSAHEHAFANALLPTRGGEALVTQAFSAGAAFADINLLVDPSTGDVVRRSAAIVTAWADEGPGLAPDPAALALTRAAEAKVAALAGRPIGAARAPIPRGPDASGESALGDLVAEAQRAAVKADFAVTNAGGLRADLPSTCPPPACTVTWGDAFGVQPFGNPVVTVTLTGAELARLLEQQWQGREEPAMLQIAGFRYAWSASAPPGRKLVPGTLRRDDGRPVEPAARYAVAVNKFLAGGGDGFTVLSGAPATMTSAMDLDALVAAIAQRREPISPVTDGRIERRP